MNTSVGIVVNNRNIYRDSKKIYLDKKQRNKYEKGYITINSKILEDKKRKERNSTI